MDRPPFVFIAGLHRSGTSLLNRILRDHPAISGFSDTGVIEDEGQHLQSVYPPAWYFGGPGRFALQADAHMDESHPLATKQSADRLFEQWTPHLDLSKRRLLEKSPPNLLKTRFLQALFPGSYFLVLLRHPIAVACATRKMAPGISTDDLLEHTLLAYEIFLRDKPFLEKIHVLRYEELVENPDRQLAEVYRFLGLGPVPAGLTVRTNINRQYFWDWDAEQENWPERLKHPSGVSLENRAQACGYSLLDRERQHSPSRPGDRMPGHQGIET